MTILLGPKLKEISLVFNIINSLGHSVLESTNSYIYQSIVRSQISIFYLGLISFIFPLFVVVSLLLSFILTAKKNRFPDYYYSHGQKLLYSKAAIKDASKKLKNEPGKPSIKIHPSLSITEQLEQGNIFVIGQQGGGKSTVIKPIAKQVYDSDCLSFTHDEKHEYQGDVKNKHTVCLELIENAEYIWDISSDVQNANDASLVAKALIEDGNDNERFFIDSARQVLKGVIISLQNSNVSWSWRELDCFLFSDTEKLKQLLEVSYPPASTLIEPDSKTTQSIRSVLSSRLFWLRDMAELQKSAKNLWSISKTIISYKNHIFFRPNYSNPELSRAVNNTLMTLLIERWLVRDDSNQQKFWMILDELGNIPKNQSLMRWLTLSRSKGGRTVAGTQNISMLYECYGTHSTETILSLFRTVIIMRLGASGPSAQKASDLLGQQRVVTFNQSLSDSDKLSISTQFHDRPVVTKEDIVNLPSSDKKGVVGFLYLGGLKNVYRLKWPFINTNGPNRANSSPSTEKPELTVIKDIKPTNRLNKRNKHEVQRGEKTKL